jgi:hypothetical protein
MGNRAAAMIFSTLTTFACAGGDPQPETSAEVFCEGVCSVAVRCGEPSTQRSCVGFCIRQEPGLSNYAFDAASAYGDCLSKLDCVVFYSEGAFEGCWETARSRVAVDERTRSFCLEHTREYFQCAYSFTTQECEDIYKMWSDGVKERVAACHATGCDALDACVGDVFDDVYAEL